MSERIEEECEILAGNLRLTRASACKLGSEINVAFRVLNGSIDPRPHRT